MKVTIVDNSSQFKTEMQKKVDKALEMIGIEAEKFASALAPVDTGNLRNSIGHASDGEAAYVGSNVEYAPYQELGYTNPKTGGHVPAANGGKGYIRPAVQDHIDHYKKIAMDTLKA